MRFQFPGLNSQGDWRCPKEWVGLGSRPIFTQPFAASRVPLCVDRSAAMRCYRFSNFLGLKSAIKAVGQSTLFFLPQPHSDFTTTTTRAQQNTINLSSYRYPSYPTQDQQSYSPGTFDSDRKSVV